MKMKPRSWLPGAHALVALAVGSALAMSLSSGAALASCEKKHRTSHRDAECLEVRWTNGFASASLYAQNVCKAKAVVKWDIRDAKDHTWYLKPGQTRTGSTGFGKVRWAWCCRDKGICNRSDRVTDQSCRKGWERSGIRKGRCTIQTLAKDGDRCRVQAKCADVIGGRTHNVGNNMRVWIDDMPRLQACGGRIKVARC